jgi:hypothetical protein
MGVAGANNPKRCSRPWQKVKREFVLEGILTALIGFILKSPGTAVGREVQRHAVFAIKELVEQPDNRQVSSTGYKRAYMTLYGLSCWRDPL